MKQIKPEERPRVPATHGIPDVAPDPRAILESIGEAIYDWDMVSDRVAWGPNAPLVLGLSAEQISSGRRYAERLSPASLSSRYDSIRAAAESGADSGAYNARYGLLIDAGGGRSETIWVEDTGRWFSGASGAPERAHGLVRVITEIYEAERRLEYRSKFDPATGCYNRSHLIEIVDSMLARRGGKNFGVLLCGLDNLFALNRTYGYDVADEALAALARRLRASMRANDHLARYAGNKFAMVLDNCDAEQLVFAAERFLDDANSAPYATSAGAIPASLRIGGVCAPRDGRKANILFQNAEEALDIARAGACRFAAYDASLWRRDSRLRAARIADGIVAALNDRRVEIALQPVVSAQMRALVFHEALLRLRQTDGTFALPGAILPVAEQAGMIHLLDQRVLELAIARMSVDADLVLSVNVSGATLRDPEWPARIHGLLAQAPDLARRLIVEITETCALADLEATKEAIAAIHALGARVAMDDFGAGQTSFRNLRLLAFDMIKLDGAFVQNLSRSSDDRFFVRTLIELARALGTPMVAEWVETSEAVELLGEWGVDYLQGDYFGQARVPEPVAPDHRLTA